MIKVLIIDDIGDIRDSTKLALEMLSPEYKVVCAEGGEDGIKLAKKEKPDVILLDIMMPKIGGWEVNKMLKDSPELKNTKVIVFTAKLDEIKEGKIPGVDGYIRKPFDLETINEKIQTALKNVGRMR